MLRHLVAVIVIVSTVVVVSQAEAADPTAQAFVDTVALGSIAANAKRAEVRASVEALEIDRCMKALGDVPSRYEDDATMVLGGGMVHAAYGPVIPELQGMVAAMDAIPISDPVLRSGRSAWRAVTGTIAELGIDRPCRQLEAWRRGGWKPSGRARAIPPAFARAYRRLESAEVERKFDAAERRLRKLGVTKAEAELWTGETAFKAIDEEMEKVLNRSLEGAAEVQAV